MNDAHMGAGSASGLGPQALAVLGADASLSAGARHLYSVECWRPRMRWLGIALGTLLGAAAFRWYCRVAPRRLAWSESFANLVVNTGLDDILDKYWKGSTYTASHFVGLTDGTPTVAAGDTMSSHAGWAEVTAYSESVRQTLTLGTVSSQSVDNSASKATYSINGTATVGGAFVTTNNTKSGTTGTLVGAGAFTGGDKSVASGDTLNVTITATQAAA